MPRAQTAIAPSYEFTVDWFSNNAQRWKQLFQGYQRRPVQWLEIGTYEGRSAIWALENILTHPKSSITCIDKWEDATLYSRFKRNIKQNHAFDGKVNSVRSTSRKGLISPAILKRSFDVIYIDADHHSSSVLEDAVLSFPLLKSGGIMIFDDYTSSKEHDNRCPKQAIDAFLAAYANDVKVIHSGWQLMLQKRVTPLPRPGCASELHDT